MKIQFDANQQFQLDAVAAVTGFSMASRRARRNMPSSIWTIWKGCLPARTGQSLANESYEEFAKALQTEYEEECGVTFGNVPITALARLAQVVDGEERQIGREAAEIIRTALVAQKMLDAEGRIQPAFNPKEVGASGRMPLQLPVAYRDLAPSVDTPVGSYNPDWAILKHDEQALNLVRETKGTRDFMKLRTGEADKVRCGQKHFEALGVPFDVVVTAGRV